MMNNPNYVTLSLPNPLNDTNLVLRIPDHLIDKQDMEEFENNLDIITLISEKFGKLYSQEERNALIDSINYINKQIKRSGLKIILNGPYVHIVMNKELYNSGKLKLQFDRNPYGRSITIIDPSLSNDELQNALLNAIGIKLNDKSEDSSKTYSNDVDIRLKSKFNDQDVIRDVYQPILDLKETVDEIESRKNNMERSNGNNAMDNKGFNKFAVTPIKFNESPRFESVDYKIEERPIRPDDKECKIDMLNYCPNFALIDYSDSFIRKDKLPGKDDDSLLTMQAIIENNYRKIVLVAIPDKYRFPYNYNQISNQIDAVEKFYNKKGIQVKIIDNEIDLLNHLYRCGKYIKEIFTFKKITNNEALELIKSNGINIEHLHEPVHHKVVTLCGSRMFIDEFIKVKNYFSKLGWIVNMPASFAISECEWIHNMSDTEIENFHSIHNQMMENSDLVYIVTKNGYYGKNTKREIEYCEKRGIPIQYHNIILD